MNVGDRVQVQHRKGFVKYIGNVEKLGYLLKRHRFQNVAGIWIGIEWDNEKDGKHDGVVHGVRYFQTRSPIGGSMVRLENVDTGIDLYTAILNRYCDEEGEIEDDSISLAIKTVEKIGMEKIRRRFGDIVHLPAMFLRSSRVSRAPPLGTTPFVLCRDLTLSDNLLHRWKDIRHILGFFPALQSLCLSNNRMGDDMSMDDKMPWNVSAELSSLRMNYCGISTKTVGMVLECLPSLRCLYVTNNGFKQFDVTSCDRLEELVLENNPIATLANLKGNFENLKRLHVGSCDLDDISFCTQGAFPALKSLYIKDNHIVKWSSFNNLSKLPNLSILHISEKEMECEKDIRVWEIMVAKLPNLKFLNGMDISPLERRSDELRFINKYGILPIEKRKDHEADIERLIQLHGAPAEVKATKGVDVIRLLIVHGEKRIEKPLPLNMTVQKLQQLVCRLFRLDARSIQLELDKNSQRILLDNLLREFSFFDPEIGDILKVVPL